MQQRQQGPAYALAGPAAVRLASAAGFPVGASGYGLRYKYGHVSRSRVLGSCFGVAYPSNGGTP